MNGCPMCLKEAELMDHLLVTCTFAILNWTSIIGWFDCSWVLPNSLGLLYHAWYGSRLHQGKDYVEGFVHCGLLVDLETEEQEMLQRGVYFGRCHPT